MDVLPEATFDTLFVASRVQQRLKDFAESEVHFFAYFGCLLSVYDGLPSDSWRYKFVKTDFGTPFSSEIQKAIRALIASKFAKGIGEGDYFNLMEEGGKRLEFLSSNFTFFHERTKYLEVACNMLTLLPYGQIRESLRNEPVIFSAESGGASRTLLESTSPATHTLHAQFRLLKEAMVGSKSRLLLPAAVWLDGLALKGK